MKSPEMSSQERKNDNPISHVESNPRVDQLKKDLKFSFWDFQAKNGIKASVVDFANDPSFTQKLNEAKQAGLSVEEMGIAVDFIRDTYGKKETAQQDNVKIPSESDIKYEVNSGPADIGNSINPEVVHIDQNPIQKDEKNFVPVGAESLRLETDAETDARMRALDDKYLVSKNDTNQQAGNDFVFETVQQGDIVEVKDSVVSENSSSSVVENVLPTAELQDQAQQSEELNNLLQEEAITSASSEKPEASNIAVEQVRTVSEPVNIGTESQSIDQVTVEGSVPDGDNFEQKVKSPESIELAGYTFNKETTKTLDAVVDSTIKLLDHLSRREDERLNGLLEESEARRFASALAGIRDSQILDDNLKKNIDKMADAFSEFGVSQEEGLAEDLESLQRLRYLVKEVEEDMVVFGKKISETYGDEAEQHIKSLTRLIDILDVGRERVTSRIFRVRDYLDR